MSDADHVPGWVPEIAPGVRADVYPVEPPRNARPPYSNSPPELTLDRSTVTMGYAERPLSCEFASCLPATVTALSYPPRSSAIRTSSSNTRAFNPGSGLGLSTSDLFKLRAGLAQLRRSRPTKLQRIEILKYPVPGENAKDSSSHLSSSTVSKNPFPLQKPSASSSLEDWFNKLSSGSSFSTSELSRSVPLGPAIVRAAGKVIEMMADRSVPIQKASWYIRVAVLNECVKQIKPANPTSFWTKQLCGLLRTEIEAIRARKTAILGSMDRLKFWNYVLDLARWQADENLLDMHQWLTRICSTLKTELSSSQSFNSPCTKIATDAARRFLPEFLSSRTNAYMLLESLLPGADSIVKAWRGIPSQPGKTESGSTPSKSNQKSNSRKATGKRFQANLCHREVTMMLSAMVRFLDNNIVGNAENETKMSDLDRFLKRGMLIAKEKRNKDSKDAKKLAEKNPLEISLHSRRNKISDVDTSAHRIMREFECVPSHGDVSRVVNRLRASAAKKGGLRGAVAQICRWAINGPTSDRGEAICIGTAVISSLSAVGLNGEAGVAKQKRFLRHLGIDIHKPRNENVDVTLQYPLQKDIWNFVKEHSRDKKPSDLTKSDDIVHFLAQLCRSEQLSLRILVRDVSKLVSHNHPGSAYLVRCLSLLPDQICFDRDKEELISTTSGDCRRSLLRKFGLISNSRQQNSKRVDELVLKAVRSGELSGIEKEVNRILKTGHANEVLTTAEAVRIMSFRNANETPSIATGLVAIPSFFIMIKQPAMGVQWLLESFSDLLEGKGGWTTETSRKKKNEVMLHLSRLVEDMARFIAALGLLDDALYLMKRAWLTSWASPQVQKRVLVSTAALAKMFVWGSTSSVPYWFKIAIRHLRQNEEGVSPAKLTTFAVACMRGQSESKPREDVKFDELLISSRDAFITPHDDLANYIAQRHLFSMSLTEVRSNLTESGERFPVGKYFARGFTGNDMLGTIFIPVLVDALGAASHDNVQTALPGLVQACLQIIKKRENDVRLQGIRPAILLEFISIVQAACVAAHCPARMSLDLLVGIRLVWKILAPSASIALCEQLRSRMDHYCNRLGFDQTYEQKGVLSAIMYNTIAKFSGDPDDRDEVAVSNSIGSEPFGMIDMQLSLLATHRRECDVDELFGSKISEAAVAMICPDSARTLASVVMQCCKHEKTRHIVAGYVGFNAVQAMADSLSFVLKGLTVQASKNTALHQERSAQWYAADTARRSILECAVDSLSQEVGVQVDSLLFDQLASAIDLLTDARERNCMPSSLFEDGRRISDALESRLRSVLRCKRTVQNAETWSQRAIQTSQLLLSGVSVMNKSAQVAAISVLVLCIQNYSESSKGGETSSLNIALAHKILNEPSNEGLKEEIYTNLKPVLSWMEDAEKTMLTQLIQEDTALFPGEPKEIIAYNMKGDKVDSWRLLEGYGRGPDEDAAVPPGAFGMQRPDMQLGTTTPVVQLKRTYSTFSSLAA